LKPAKARTPWTAGPAAGRTSFARKHKEPLIIAKLDRLARNVAFISQMMEAKVDFIAVDNPHATRLTLHILAAVAERLRAYKAHRLTLCRIANALNADGIASPGGVPGIQGMCNGLWCGSLSVLISANGL